jgi:hypothetical protein
MLKNPLSILLSYEWKIASKFLGYDLGLLYKMN